MPTPPIQVNPERCTGCGLCVRACPFDAIRINGKTAAIDFDQCTLCGSCISACPRPDTLSMADTAPTQCTSGGEVWVLCEACGGQLRPVSRELLGTARSLANRQNAQTAALLLLGEDSRGLVRETVAAGANTVYTVTHPALAEFQDETWANVCARALRRHTPDILLGGATALGRALLPRLAILLDTGLTADCTQLDLDLKTGLLEQTRPAFGGNILATIVCRNKRPQMATVRPGVLPAPEPDFTRSGRHVPLAWHPEDLDERTRTLEVRPVETDAVDLHGADIVVTAGMGCGGPEGVALVRRLADHLGAPLGATRAVVDAGWLPYAHQIGQTGTTVQPRVYLACGVSGAIQHRVGMQSSNTIIAINRDPEAPIFQHADYAVLGDLHEIIRDLLNALPGARSPRSEAGQTPSALHSPSLQHHPSHLPTPNAPRARTQAQRAAISEFQSRALDAES